MADGDEQRKARYLGDGCDECRGRCGRAFVGVGRPEMKREGGYLEAETGSDHDQRNVEERCAAFGRRHISAEHDARQTR